MNFENIDTTFLPSVLHVPIAIMAGIFTAVLLLVTLFGGFGYRNTTGWIMHFSVVAAFAGASILGFTSALQNNQIAQDALQAEAERVYGLELTPAITEELLQNTVTEQDARGKFGASDLQQGGPELQEKQIGTSTFYVNNRRTTVTLMWRKDRWVLANQNGVQLPVHHDTMETP